MLSNQVAGDTFESIARDGYFTCKIKKLPLMPGNYTAGLIVVPTRSFLIDPTGGDNRGRAGRFLRHRRTPPTHSGVLLEQEWTLNGSR